MDPLALGIKFDRATLGKISAPGTMHPVLKPRRGCSVPAMDKPLLLGVAIRGTPTLPRQNTAQNGAGFSTGNVRHFDDLEIQRIDPWAS
jgi:hypothetical protein